MQQSPLQQLNINHSILTNHFFTFFHLNLQSYFGRRPEGRGRSQQLQTASMSFCTSECLRSGDSLMDSVGCCQISSRLHNCRNVESLKLSFLAFCLEFDAGRAAASSSLAEAAWSMQLVSPKATATCQGVKVVVIPGVLFGGWGLKLTLWWRTTTAKCVFIWVSETRT